MDLTTLPSRKEYIREQKEKHGRRLFGVFPAYFPREILWSANILPVEIWDPPLDSNLADAHLQPTICSIAKLGLELILRGKCDDIDGFVFPHPCDSIQNLASVVNDYLAVSKPCYFFYNPKAPFGKSTRKYYIDCLKRFLSEIEQLAGPVKPEDLLYRVRQGRRISELIGNIYEKRVEGALPVSGIDFYRVIRMGEFLHPDDFIPLLESFLAKANEKTDERPAVLLSGILPAPGEMLRILDDTGIRIGDDDLINCKRRLVTRASESDDPFETLADACFSLPPCSTRNSLIKERLSWIMDSVEKTKARGIIFSMVKFCETEMFDLPPIVDTLKKHDIATLVIESEVNRDSDARTATRIEAFAELLFQRG